MVPLTPPAVSGLTGTAVLLLSGMMDPVVPQAHSRRLAAMLRRGGAAVTHLELPAGHQLTSVDVHRMAAWLPTALR
jgi:phospholipase/carboxylesterase